MTETRAPYVTTDIIPSAYDPITASTFEADIEPESYITLNISQAPGRRTYAVTFIRAGQVRRRDNTHADWMIPAETLRSATDMLNGRAVFIDHPDPSFTGPGYPSVRDLVGVTFGAHYNEAEQSIDGFIRMYDHTQGQWITQLLDQLITDQQAGQPIPDVGLSLVFFGRHNWKEEGDIELKVTEAITHVESCDLVFGPAADGRIRQMLSRNVPTARKDHTQMNNDKEPAITPTAVPEGGEEPSETLGAPHPSLPSRISEGAAPDDIAAQLTNLTNQVERLTQALAHAIEPTVVKGMGTPPTEPRPKQPADHLRMWDTRDRIQLAYEKLMGLPISHDVPRLTGIRELYTLLTGDRELTGRYRPELAMLANTGYDGDGNNADTTAMAEITRNVMNKALVAQFDLLKEYQWWQRIAHIEDFNSLQQVSWVRVGGIGDLPTVAEKGEYTQLAWDDARVAADWVKKGGYLPLSLEMIDRDDVQAWRSVPRQLATAAEVTLSSTVSALFTDNSGIGPSITTEGSTDNAFSSTWGNLITQPLDYTNWGTAIETMYQLAQLNVSGRAQAVRPKYLLVPIELEPQAIAVATSPLKPGTDYNDRVPTRRLLPEENVITVPHWTDDANWAAVADPALCPFVGVGFRFGRSPELFTASDPATHLLFTNDVLPIKVRWFFAVSVIDPRGAIKSNN
jgi:hypothetical protein